MSEGRPFDRLRERGAEARRLGQVAATAAPLVRPWALAALSRGERRTTRRQQLYRRITGVLEELGPTYIKAGQILGTRRDILPQSLCDELEQLTDAVRPLSEAESARVLERLYDGRLDAHFSEVGLSPVASGSVACVYRAVRTNGDVVALKVLRPQAPTLVALDLELASRIGRFLAVLPGLRRIPMVPMLDELSATVRAQLDFDRERANLAQLREDLATVPRIWIPKTVPELCRPGCLAMEFIPGLQAQSARSMSVATRKRLAGSTLDVIYQMLFLRGFVHCDLHPGNLYFLRSGHVVVLDAGFTVQLTDRLRVLFAEFFLNMSIGRGEKCAELVLLSSATVPDDADLPAFTAAMAALVTRVHGLTAVEFSLVDFALSMFAVQRDHGIVAAPELLFPLLSLMVVEGTVRDLDPEIDFQERARPHLVKGRFGVGAGR